MSDDDGNIKAEWNINYEDLEFGTMIGKGNFGKVYRGELFGTDVAIKELLQTDDDEENKKYTDREVSMLTGVRHPNVVNFMGVAKRIKKGNEVYYIVTEWLPGGNLRKLMKDPTVHLSWKRRIEFARDTALAMNYLHQKSIIHRDLKSANLMLAADGSLKVCDFGLARRKNAKKHGLMTMAGTEEWMAPEIIVGDEYDEKCDVFSFGVVLYELITRQKPLPRGPSTFFEFNKKEWDRNIPRDCPRKFAELALKCVDYYGKNRPSFAQVVKELKTLLQSEELQQSEGPSSVILSPRKESPGEKEDPKKDLKKRLMEAELQLKSDETAEHKEEEDPKDMSLKKENEEEAKQKKKGDKKEKGKDKKPKDKGKDKKTGGKGSPHAGKKKAKGDGLDGEDKTAEALLTKYYSKHGPSAGDEAVKKEKRKSWGDAAGKKGDKKEEKKKDKGNNHHPHTTKEKLTKNKPHKDDK